jgi:cytosine/creatinine deaminase
MLCGRGRRRVYHPGVTPDATDAHTYRDARLADGRRVDITVSDGLVTAVEPHRAGAGDAAPGTSTDLSGDDDAAPGTSTDLSGWLVLPAMAEPHAHVDKALTAERVPNPTGDLLGAIDAWVAADAAGVFTHDDMVARIRWALEKLLLNGVTAVRSHINAGARSGTTHLAAAVEAAAEFDGLMDPQFVSLVHTPMTGPGSEPNVRALYDCADLGARVMGGCPHLEPDPVGAIDVVIEAARERSAMIDLHTDETLDPGVLTLRDLARRVEATGFESLVAASHCVSLGMQTPDVQREVAREIAAAGIAIVTLPQTNLFLQGRDQPTATPRGLTALHALLDADVLVAAGADNVQDPFNLVGRSDPLETAALLVMAGHLLPDEAYDLVSNNVRRTMGLAPVTFEAGSPADFVAIDAPSVRGAIADAPADRVVIHRGRVVAHSSTTREIVPRSEARRGPADRGLAVTDDT